jgi:hypothetical protein
VLGTVPTTDTRAALCYLTPAPRTARRGESSLGPYSLGIDVRDQLLPLSLGYPLPGSCSLGTRARRAPHNGSASSPTGPRLSTLSALWDRHVVRSTHHTLRQAAGAPTSCTGPSSCILGVSTPVSSPLPILGSPRRSNIQRPARLQQKKARMPSQELPRRTGSGVTGVAPMHRGQGRSTNHAATVMSYRARHTTSAHKTPRSKYMYRPCASLQL